MTSLLSRCFYASHGGIKSLSLTADLDLPLTIFLLLLRKQSTFHAYVLTACTTMRRVSPTMATIIYLPWRQVIA